MSDTLTVRLAAPPGSDSSPPLAGPVCAQERPPRIPGHRTAAGPCSGPRASFCGVSEASWYRLKSASRLPAPVRLGGRVLWRVEGTARFSLAGVALTGRRSRPGFPPGRATAGSEIVGWAQSRSRVVTPDSPGATPGHSTPKRKARPL